MPKNGKLVWDIHEVATALKIDEADVKRYFTDGRRVSFIIERRLAKEVLKSALAPSEGSDFDLYDSHGGKWEARSITRGGVYFCPSNQVGKGRKFNLPGFQAKMDNISGYILADVASFPDVPFWIVPIEHVKSWWAASQLGKNSHISRDKALGLLESLGKDVTTARKQKPGPDA
jgi:hypothetical protein